MDLLPTFNRNERIRDASFYLLIQRVLRHTQVLGDCITLLGYLVVIIRENMLGARTVTSASHSLWSTPTASIP